ncbi:hypothetical protein [Amycolatopsis sp. FDAARGOS 1241]|uniref:hypothetical protein n=1 Tax=Amycolatopsis sp. FDAARGOS 1241 TaxID=2778070 RepID=UPI00194F80F3|nr:hypothetical protein [Amycolatopsis sp. FDAARGOS 1241]QRP43673.1 hypothetical protein I6J71_30420 [Amycolatopsis sp. FDAARGOS 1241]
MYATVHQFRRATAGESDGWGPALAADLHHDPAPLGGCVLGQVAGVHGAAVAFWPDAAAAAEASAHTATGPTWLDTDVFDVVQAEFAPGAPRYAQATWFAGPRDAARVRAESFAGTQRVWPAARQVPGAGPVFVLRGADGAALVLGFAESVTAIEAIQRAVLATELLPGEDLALLTGPDRIDLHRVFHDALPADVTLGGTR